MARLLHKQVRVILTDGRHLVGKLLSFDGHMNLVLLETQEFRKTKAGDRTQRALGLVMLRGDTVTSAIAENSLVKKERDTQPISMQL